MSVFLVTHIAGGFLALLAMIVAFVATKGSSYHRYAGKAYVAAMTVSLVMALVVSVRTGNVFLGLIAVFSAYFVYTGWRLGARRKPDVILSDRLAVGLLGLSGVGMILFGIYMASQREGLFPVLLVFGAVAIGVALSDRRWLVGWPTGKERLTMHLGRMGGASIATLTAPTVVNIRTEPEFIAWFLPGMVVTPLIIYWGRRVRAGKMTLHDGR